MAMGWVKHGQTASAGNHVVPGFSGCSRRTFREPKSCLAMGRVRTKTVKKAWCWIQPIQLDPIFTTGVWSRNAWTLSSMEASWRNHSDIFWIPFERIAAGCPRDRGEVLRQTDPGLPVPWTIRSRWALGLWVNGWHWVNTSFLAIELSWNNLTKSSAMEVSSKCSTLQSLLLLPVVIIKMVIIAITGYNYYNTILSPSKMVQNLPTTTRCHPVPLAGSTRRSRRRWPPSPPSACATRSQASPRTWWSALARDLWLMGWDRARISSESERLEWLQLGILSGWAESLDELCWGMDVFLARRAARRLDHRLS